MRYTGERWKTVGVVVVVKKYLKKQKNNNNKKTYEKKCAANFFFFDEHTHQTNLKTLFQIVFLFDIDPVKFCQVSKEAFV